MNDTETEVQVNDEKQVFQTWPIKDTPFVLNKLDQKYFVALGKYRLSEAYDSFESAMAGEQPDKITWPRVMQVIQIMIEENKTNK